MLRALQEKWAGPKGKSQSSTRPISGQPQQRRAQSASGRYLTTLQGRVVSLKPDSYREQTGTHELFVISVGWWNTVLVANNVDVGTRVNPRIGDYIEVCGEYIPRSGDHRDNFIHLTHRSRSGREAGWIRYQGRKYD
jgi:hypothetical protein